MLQGIILSSRYQFNISASSDSEDDSFLDIMKTAQMASLEELDEDGDDMEDLSPMKQKGMRTKNEIMEDNGPVKVTDISIGPTTPVNCLGTVEKVMDSIAIVKAHTDGEYRILDEGAFVLNDARQIMGTVRTINRNFSDFYLDIRNLWSCKRTTLCDTAHRKCVSGRGELDGTNAILCSRSGVVYFHTVSSRPKRQRC
jgi:hypothetical protein